METDERRTRARRRGRQEDRSRKGEDYRGGTAGARDDGSPFGDGDRPSKRDDHKAEVEPGPISLSVLRKHENMDYEPHTRRESQSKPNQIFGGLMCRPNCFALGTAYTCNDDDERPKKQRAKNDRQRA